MSQEKRQAVYQQSISEHHRLLAGTEAVLGKWPTDAAEAAQKKPYLVQALDELHSRLQAHFDAEETPEYLCDDVANSPRLASRARELQRQHGQLIAALDGLIANVQQVEHGPARLAQERDALQTLIRDLRQHEQAEDDLLLEAVNDDLGSGD